MSTSTLTAERRATLHRRIRLIVAFTIVYNVIEAAVAIAAGSVASSAALIGFGLDSSIEVLSAAAVAWQFTRRDPERWETPTLRVIAVAFFALAAYVVTSSVLSLLGGDRPEHSTVGLVLTAVSVIVMPLVSFAERRAGLVIAVFAVREGLEAWKGDACATSIGMILEDEHEHHDHDHEHVHDDHRHDDARHMH